MILDYLLIYGAILSLSTFFIKKKYPKQYLKVDIEKEMEDLLIKNNYKERSDKNVY